MDQINKYTIGTAQFGMVYGISNCGEPIEYDQVASIIRYASALGINTLDTAVSYGFSESILGRVGLSHWNAITKLPPVPVDCDSICGWIDEMVAGSLSRLGITKLEGLLLHAPGQLLEANGEEIYYALKRQKHLGKTRKIGISIYCPSELDVLLRRYQVDIVQAPLNVYDRRLIDSGWLSKLRLRGVEVHVRSIFLQGLLLMRPEELPERLAGLHDLHLQWFNWLESKNLSALEACLAFVNAQSEIDRIIVGVHSTSQLLEMFQGVRKKTVAVPSHISSSTIEHIDPRLW